MRNLDHARRSMRLRGYDYGHAGAYFVTICTQGRACLFGEVVDGETCLNRAGRMVEDVWSEMPRYYPAVGVDGFVVMPNHIHGIITLSPHVGAGPRARPGPGQPRGVCPYVIVTGRGSQV